MNFSDEIATVIAKEKRLCDALGKRWSPSEFSIRTLAEEAAAEIERMRARIRELEKEGSSSSETGRS